MPDEVSTDKAASDAAASAPSVPDSVTDSPPMEDKIDAEPSTDNHPRTEADPKIEAESKSEGEPKPDPPAEQETSSATEHSSGDVVKASDESYADECECSMCVPRDLAFEGERLKMLVADWKFLDYDHYKNRFEDSECVEIIEVLRGYKHLEQEIWQEVKRHPKMVDENGRKLKRERMPYLTFSKDIGLKDDYVQRIRIQSPALILLLSRVTGNHDRWSTETPRTFFRPFTTQYYYLARMREILAVLEKNWGQSTSVSRSESHPAEGTQQTPESGSNIINDESSVDTEDSEDVDIDYVVHGPIADSATALQHVKTYIRFVEKFVVPLWEVAQGTSKRRVTWPDLWASFRDGEILFRPSTASASEVGEKAAMQTLNKTHQSAWRLYSITRDNFSDEDMILGDSTFRKGRNLNLHCYYIDYDGKSYRPVHQQFSIPYYDGEKDIAQLPIYPLRFHKNKEAELDKFKKQGTLFHDFMTKRYLFYDGWTLTQDPAGESGGIKDMLSEHIDSTVIVDFVEGYKSESSLKSPTFQGLVEFEDSGDWPEGQDRMKIRHWRSSRSKFDRKQKARTTIPETTQGGEFFGRYLFRRHCRDRKHGKFLHDSKLGRAADLCDDDLALLPCRLVAFAFRERKFILANIEFLREVPKQDDVFQNLMIDPQHKEMIESLVETHFQKQAMQKDFGSINLNQDLIRGKGSGLVMLLHGVPGVGKTATAEAIAQLNNKPLFTITCGDLGFAPREVDASLRNIFRLAHLWDCVLLLDEAEVFLSRRDITDLKRNALVSVFLRVLEYYSGILFLTTNRVGHLDEAFKSRIHISLYYPPLDEHQTVNIFRVNIKQLLKIEDEKQKLMKKANSGMETRPKMDIDVAGLLKYAAFHCETRPQPERWNGRQIRNVFQIAYSLAQKPTNDMIVTPDMDIAQRRRLTPAHLEKVAMVIENFDDYLAEALGSKPYEIAQDTRTRADNYGISTDPAPAANPRPDTRANGVDARRPSVSQPRERFQDTRDRGGGASQRHSMHGQYPPQQQAQYQQPQPQQQQAVYHPPYQQQQQSRNQPTMPLQRQPSYQQPRHEHEWPDPSSQRGFQQDWRQGDGGHANRFEQGRWQPSERQRGATNGNVDNNDNVFANGGAGGSRTVYEPRDVSGFDIRGGEVDMAHLERGARETGGWPGSKNNAVQEDEDEMNKRLLAIT